MVRPLQELRAERQGGGHGARSRPAGEAGFWVHMKSQQVMLNKGQRKIGVTGDTRVRSEWLAGWRGH